MINHGPVQAWFRHVESAGVWCRLLFLACVHSSVRGARRCPDSCEDGFRVQSVTYSVLEIDNILRYNINKY